MREMADKLDERNEKHLDNERTFLSDLKRKEDTHKQTQHKIRELNEDIKDRDMKLDYLNRMKDEHKATENNLKRAIEMKQATCDEVSRELRGLKSEYDKQSVFLEQTLQNETGNKTQNELHLTMQIENMAKELNTLKQQKE